MTTNSDIIDWDEAMEQCGDDEEFLRELLADLRGETDSQVAKIEETIRVRGKKNAFENFPSSRLLYIPSHILVFIIFMFLLYIYISS